MKKQIIYLSAIAFTGSLVFTSCKKYDADETTQYTNQEILTSFSTNVAYGTYNDLNTKIGELYTAVQTFNASSTQSNLVACRSLWKESRAAWEQSEGFLFGPVATEDIDPRIDTWPMDSVALNNVLNSTTTFDEAYINSLDDALRGFHPVEYILWGANSTKTATEVTAKEKEYLLALAANLKTLIGQLPSQWELSVSSSYASTFSAAGNNGIYPTVHAAFIELASAMAGICDEVANGKMEDPFVAQDPALEESPFAKNSIIDFTNNITSVENVYLGKYSTDGKALENFVRANNLSLDGTIKTKIANAKQALANITVPFGDAISSQPTQVLAAQTAINELKNVLETDLVLLIDQKIQ